VTVIDDEWVLVQSGNYTEASIPENTHETTGPYVAGNRDAGLAFRSTAMAAFYTRLLRADIARAEVPPDRKTLALASEREVVMFEAATRVVPTRFRSRRFTDVTTAQPLVTPDNFIAAAEARLAAATTSIDIEEQYIRANQPQVQRLLRAIASARAAHPRLRVRIILAPPFGGFPDPQLARDVDGLEADWGLPFGTTVRLLDRRRFLHCHNKLIVIDRRLVIVGSQNWSDTGVTTNREAATAIAHEGIARYFSRIVGSDWLTASRVRPGVSRLEDLAGTPPRTVRVRPGDYAEV
jgi:phosphatidylserine/phosphatidylglycerophosphate/cardiolipin synthase-like enzyme